MLLHVLISLLFLCVNISNAQCPINITICRDYYGCRTVYAYEKYLSSYRAYCEKQDEGIKCLHRITYGNQISITECGPSQED